MIPSVTPPRMRDDPSDHQTAAMTHRIVSVEFSLWASMANITSRRL